MVDISLNQTKPNVDICRRTFFPLFKSDSSDITCYLMHRKVEMFFFRTEFFLYFNK